MIDCLPTLHRYFWWCRKRSVYRLWWCCRVTIEKRGVVQHGSAAFIIQCRQAFTIKVTWSGVLERGSLTAHVRTILTVFNIVYSVEAKRWSQRVDHYRKEPSQRTQSSKAPAFPRVRLMDGENCPTQNGRKRALFASSTRWYVCSRPVCGSYYTGAVTVSPVKFIERLRSTASTSKKMGLRRLNVACVTQEERRRSEKETTGSPVKAKVDDLVQVKRKCLAGFPGYSFRWHISCWTWLNMHEPQVMIRKYWW